MYNYSNYKEYNEARLTRADFVVANYRPIPVLQSKFFNLAIHYPTQHKHDLLHDGDCVSPVTGNDVTESDP